MIMRLVEQRRVDLDQPVVRYLPEFRLKDAGAAEAILVRQLLDHTNGIDADTLMPIREFGPRAVESYVDVLAHCGVLFPPGTFTHYTNPGFSLAARMIERLEGVPFNEALERDLFAPLGIMHSCTSATQAILHRTAIGAFTGAARGELRATDMFMLPVSGAGAGTTAIVTVDDLIAFGRMHLDNGVAADGRAYLSTESTSLMRMTAFDLGSPNSPPDQAWVAHDPIAGTTALWHGGGSPGGVSSPAVFPEHDLVIVGFATGPGAAGLQDAIVKTVLRELLGLRVEAPFTSGPRLRSLTLFEGAYGHFQYRSEVAADGDQLVVQPHFKPFDDDHRAKALGFRGTLAAPSFRLDPINETLFAPAGAPLDKFHGIWGRMGLHSFHRPDDQGRPAFHRAGWRASKRA